MHFSIPVFAVLSATALAAPDANLCTSGTYPSPKCCKGDVNGAFSIGCEDRMLFCH